MWRDHRGSSLVETGMLGNFLSCLKVVNEPFEAQEGRWDFSRDTTVEKGLISRRGENLLFFSRVEAGNLGFLSTYDGASGPARVGSGKSILQASCEEHGRIPLQSEQGPRSSSRVEAGHQGSSPVLTWISGFLWSFKRGVRPRLMWRHASPLSSQAVQVVAGFLSS